MLAFDLVRQKQISFEELCSGLTIQDLHNLSDEIIDTALGLIGAATDASVTFQPEDPEAFDEHAADPEEVSMPWTLGHVIAHVTASSEDMAAVASGLARGAAYAGHARFEVPWRSLTSLVQLKQRLEESRRMRHAFLDTWPAEPHLDNTYTPDYPGARPRNAISVFVRGIAHEESHLAQMAEIVRQAGAAGVRPAF